MKGFWNSLIACLDDLQEKGMMRGSWNRYLHVVDSLDGLIAALQ
jgi:predicted Rossmann-fold nucleotide-binding protein